MPRQGATYSKIFRKAGIAWGKGDLSKAIAILVLEAVDDPIDLNTPDPLKHLRKTLAIPKMPDGVWRYVQEQYPYSRQHLKRFLNILQLPTIIILLRETTNILFDKL